MRIKEAILELLFPRKCVLCRKMLAKDETDICFHCRENAPEFKKTKKSIPFVAGWTAVWYYSERVRGSILRYKFRGASGYAAAYGRALAMRIQKDEMQDVDVLTWVPISAKRQRKRGYDQGELLAQSVGRELGITPVRCLKKVRDNGPQSRIRGSAERKANVLGVYTVPDRELVRGKRVLILDDVVTTGATVSECARMLLTAGAEKVYCAAVAASDKDRKR